MVRSTQIARVSDLLPLAQSVDDESGDLAQAKQQARLLFRRLTPASQPRCSIESGALALHYIISPPPGDPAAVVYLVITDRTYPRKLAFLYLDDIVREFERSYGAIAVQPTLRPYACVGFDTFLQRTKRLYADSRMASTSATCTAS